MSREIRNARIEGTQLGREDHGIMTAMISTMSGSSGQGFGGYSLKGEWGMEFITRILDTLGASSWECLPGTFCRIDADYDKIHRIGHIIEDKWFDPDEIKKP